MAAQSPFTNRRSSIYPSICLPVSDFGRVSPRGARPSRNFVYCNMCHSALSLRNRPPVIPLKIHYKPKSETARMALYHTSLASWSRQSRVCICDCDGKFHLALFLFRPLTLNLTSDLLDSPYLLYRRSLALLGVGVGLSDGVESEEERYNKRRRGAGLIVMA